MKAMLLKYLVDMVLALLTPDLLKKFIDMVLDFVENTVAKSDTKVDDEILIPLCNLLRATFNVPDNDTPDEA